jgi:hypothetical protein
LKRTARIAEVSITIAKDAPSRETAMIVISQDLIGRTLVEIGLRSTAIRQLDNGISYRGHCLPPAEAAQRFLES